MTAHLAADRAREKVYIKISNLADKLADIAAMNLEEMNLKARYVVGIENGDIEDSVAESVRDLLGGEPPVSDEVAGSWRGRRGDESSAAAKNEYGRRRENDYGIVGMMKEYAASIALAMGGT